MAPASTTLAPPAPLELHQVQRQLGVVLLLRTFGRIPVAVSYVLHDISALIMLGGIFIHIYLSTFGEPGTFQAMIRGAVSEAWAWTFHPAWYKQVTGRDAQQACEEARRQMAAGGKH